MGTSALNNTRIAKNTLLLYMRTIIVLFVSLYTSRLILKALGAEDLGIHNVVGGVIILMSFFKSSLAKATSRFITYELGLNSNEETIKKVFSVSVTIHIIIVLLLLLLGETVGIWILNHWISIPEARQDAAFWVFQFSLATFCIHVLLVPFNAVIIAHENMKVYAYMAILEVLLQLGLVLFLLRYEGDRLILYGALLSVVALVSFLCYWFYVRLKYPIYRFMGLTWDSDYSKRILAFSGWTMLGTSANVATQQGVSLLFNNYVGLIANAALGFANQVNNAVSSFVGNFATAFNPQIIKLCAQKEYALMHLLMKRASKFSFALFYVMALPLIFNTDFVMDLWLGDVPQYAVQFCQLILMCSIIDATTSVLNTTMTATGRIRGYQIVISISFLMDLVCAFVLFSVNINAVLVFASRIVTRGFINMFIGLYFVRKETGFSVRKYVKEVLLPISLVILTSVPIMFCICRLLRGWACLLVSTTFSIVFVGLMTLFVIMNRAERQSVLLMVKNKLSIK